MKRLLLILLSFVAVSCFAQTVNKDQRVKEIRQLYADALAGVKEQSESDTPPIANMTMKIRRIEPAVGVVTYENDFFQELPNENYSFFRSKRTFGPYLPTYVEALYDTDGHLVFLFHKEPFIYDDQTYVIEQRIYWNTDGSVCSVNNKKVWNDGKVEVPNDEDAIFEDLNVIKANYEDQLKQCATFLYVAPIDPDYE